MQDDIQMSGATSRGQRVKCYAALHYSQTSLAAKVALTNYIYAQINNITKNKPQKHLVTKKVGLTLSQGVWVI